LAFTSGSRVTAAALNRITRNDLEAAVSTSYTVTTSEGDVTGASITLTTIQANTKVKITASLDLESSGTSDSPFVYCYVDGVKESDDMNIIPAAGRRPRSKTWLVTLGSIGSHTIKLRAVKSGAANTVTIFSTHSTLIISGNGIS
jgi:hypothetical protein